MTLIIGLMPAFGAWLKTTRLIELSVWIGNTKLSNFLNQNNWITPTLQSVHIMAIAATFGAGLMISLRVAGLSGQSQSLQQVAQRYTPWIRWGLLTLFATGLVLLLAEPSRQLLSPYFWTKMTLVVVMTLATFWFETSVRRDAPLWRPRRVTSTAVRVGAIGAICVWAAIMVLGRWIAYGV